jgi:hypothetical protein
LSDAVEITAKVEDQKTTAKLSIDPHTDTCINSTFKLRNFTSMEKPVTCLFEA